MSFNLDAGRWGCHDPAPEATMDHRGLVFDGSWLVLVGGMGAGEEVRAGVVSFDLSQPGPCE